MTAPRHVFFVSNARLTVHRRCGSEWLDPVPFDAGAEGLARFARYLERHPGDPACVIADVVEEEFREETVPHVFGADRRALLRKRASRLFRDARHVRSAVQEREPDGRRDDRVLFSAITRPGVLAPWLEEMARRGVPLAGICSPATLTGAMLKAIGAGDERVLVVSLQSGGGLRQTCLRRGRLELSRLAVTPGSRDAADVLAEVGKTRRYLDGLRTPPPGERLRVCLLSHGGMLDDLRRRAGGDPEDGYVFVDLSDAARRLGLRRWDGEPIADRLFVHALARRAVRNHYATPEEMRRFTTLRAAAFLRVASVFLVAGGFLFGGVRFLEGALANGHALALARQAEVYEGRYREARATLPPAPAEPEELERVVAAVDVLRARRSDPVELFALIGDALAGFPQVRVESVSWWTRDALEAPAGGTGSPAAGGGAQRPRVRVDGGSRQAGDVARLDVLDDRAVGPSRQQRQPEAAAQEGVEVPRPDARRVGRDLEHVLRRPHSGHFRTRVGHPSYRARARHQSHVRVESQVGKPGGGGVGLLQKIGVREVRVQHAAARQERHAVFGIGNVVPRELRSVVDAALVPARESAKIGPGRGQAFQKHPGLHRARQVRPAVEPPALPLDPAARNVLLLHGRRRHPSTKDHPAGAVIRDPNPREHPATGSATPVGGREPPAGAFSPPR